MQDGFGTRSCSVPSVGLTFCTALCLVVCHAAERIRRPQSRCLRLHLTREWQGWAPCLPSERPPSVPSVPAALGGLLLPMPLQSDCKLRYLCTLEADQIQAVSAGGHHRDHQDGTVLASDAAGDNSKSFLFAQKLLSAQLWTRRSPLWALHAGLLRFLHGALCTSQACTSHIAARCCSRIGFSKAECRPKSAA